MVADHVCDGAEAGKVDHPRDGRATGDDHLGLVFLGQRLDLVIVDQVVLPTHAVLDRVEPLARLVRCRAVGQVAARGQVHAQDGVARLQQRLVHPLVGLAARVGLHVGEFAVEQLFRALDGQVLGNIDELAAAIVTPTGIALGVLVGQNRALRLQHCGRDDVFGCDQFDLISLAAQLRFDGARDLGVAFGQGLGEKCLALKGLVCIMRHVVDLRRAAVRRISYRKPDMLERL